MFRHILLLCLITLIPALELRASIPWGILGNEKLGVEPGLMSWPMVMLVCILANALLGLAVFWILAPIMKWFERFVWFRRWCEPILVRMQKKLHPYVEKYGELGVAIFIGIPLPGSGVYTGAVGAFLLGLERKKFFVANLLGVVIAGVAVTALSLAIRAGLNIPFKDLWLK